MQKAILFVCGSVLAAGIVGGSFLFRQYAPAPPVLSAAAPPAAPTPEPADEPAPPVPPAAPQAAVTPELAPSMPPAPAPEAAANPQPTAEPAPSPAPPSTPSESLSALPVQEVEPRAVHTVPETEPAVIPHVTLLDRQGRTLARSSASAPPPTSYVPSVGPAANGASSAPPASYKPSALARGSAAQGAQQAALPPVPASLSGTAHATGTVSLAIDGHVVRLYGVLPPASTDKCALGTGASQTCAEVTQTILAARLARSTSVTCQLPPGVGAADPARVCLDATGVDIAGYLVSEGLAVADRHAGGGYAGAESIAQSNGKGLWRSR